MVSTPDSTPPCTDGKATPPGNPRLLKASFWRVFVAPLKSSEASFFYVSKRNSDSLFFPPRLLLCLLAVSSVVSKLNQSAHTLLLRSACFFLGPCHCCVFVSFPGGNEESELCELQTAREWSDDEDGGGPDEDDGLASSPSIWGTPRQNSFELTFSYIAIAEAAGAARQHRERRSRVGSRGSRVSVVDAPEKLLDSPDVEWDPHAFLAQEEEAEASGEDGDNETITVQPSPQSPNPDGQMDAGTQREEPVSGQAVQPPPPSPSSQRQSPSHTHPGKRKQQCVKRLFAVTEPPPPKKNGSGDSPAMTSPSVSQPHRLPHWTNPSQSSCSHLCDPKGPILHGLPPLQAPTLRKRRSAITGTQHPACGRRRAGMEQVPESHTHPPPSSHSLINTRRKYQIPHQKWIFSSTDVIRASMRL